ncbi:hypothetical protein D6C79_04183 [Aureobasidium pullulans]|nr:hypothetical protein D6C79_04183 [Aureobasidium pullulans]
MPCFKGIAVSIHTPEGPLAEHGVQSLSRFGRINTYIPVPPPTIPPNSTTGQPQQSTFAVSITLLTSGLKVPYSTPRPTPTNPNPKGVYVGPQTAGMTRGLPRKEPAPIDPETGKPQVMIPPYQPRTSSPNETIAAYIYFDGRQKEEVATLLRKGEETWVNSRWVSIPDTEGGGLAEREFLFREVGLERWLNGLDLTSTDKEAKAALIDKRRKKFEKMRQREEKKREIKRGDSDDEDDDGKPRYDRNTVLRYGEDNGAPTEAIMGDDEMSDSDSDSDMPESEAAGQIKIVLFRVLASGEIKRGEYSPQFDVHDDEGTANDAAEDEDVDHTTGLDKPKTLDPKSISTQTVTGIDPPDSPFATFTFYYRSPKQLEKMGVIAPSRKASSTVTRKRSTDFSKLGPLKNQGTKGFSSYRDPAARANRKGSKNADAMDSDEEDEEPGARDEMDDVDVKDENGNPLILTEEDRLRQEEMAEGVRHIKLKRQHSGEFNNPTPSKSPHVGASTAHITDTSASPSDKASHKLLAEPTDEYSESPLKKQRPSLGAVDASPLGKPSLTGPSSAPTTHPSAPVGASPLSASTSAPQVHPAQLPPSAQPIDEDEEL